LLVPRFSAGSLGTIGTWPIAVESRVKKRSFRGGGGGAAEGDQETFQEALSKVNGSRIRKERLQ